MIERTPMGSSNVISAGYDPESQTLEVEFPGHRIYRLTPVSPVEWAEFEASGSKGRHYAAVLRPRGIAVPYDGTEEPAEEPETPEETLGAIQMALGAVDTLVEALGYTCPHCHQPATPGEHLDRVANAYTCPRG